ncbi:hypothetical protein CC2G_002262 [Coprinopsis cinerea AmutBmut pab1-1]|nr:hypothetical protein CC2G_002262 [Coprinopsis cinerea AmutBmut pab1-1]
MWSKITHALRPRQAQESSQSQGEVLSKVFEQHPNLSVFNPNDPNANTSSNPSPPPSPSKGGKRTVLKRISKLPPKEDNENAKTAGSLRLTKKSRPPLHFNTVGSNSQLSLPVDSHDDLSSSADISRRASFDMLKSSTDSNKASSSKSRTSIDVLRRPSLDLLRNEPSQDGGLLPSPALEERPAPMTPGFNDRMGSVRSILRDPKTPGTGQNVRFFSRDAYKVISPEQSMDTEDHFFAPPPPPKDDTPSFLERLHQTSPDGTSTPAVFRNGHNKSHSKSSRPSVSEVFSPLTNTAPLLEPPSQDGEQSMSLASPVPASKSGDLFEVSQSLNLPPFNPPGLDFDVHSPLFDQSIELDTSFDTSDVQPSVDGGRAQLTSTPFRSSDGSKGKERENTEEQDATNPIKPDISSTNQVPLPTTEPDESIFHAKDVPPRLPTPLHDRSQSFTMGQTVFYSMGDEDSRRSSKGSPAYASSDLKDMSFSSSSTSSKRESFTSATKSRARAISDTVLQNMLRSTKSPPEADINDESSDNLVVYAPPVAEPDPFSAHASTYYTPQVMIPVTPPQHSKQHVRKTSKEESLIYSLQTQLAIQNDLCQQYEIDLRARDEMVNTLTQKLSDVEKEDNKRRATLRNWKKKVQELERACRQLEEEVDSSRQMSFERSVMDEASGEALRMLHRQIAALERDRADQLKREEMLKEEIAHLETLVKDRSEDVSHLKEMLWNRDESERELQVGLREAKEQMDQLGNQATEDERARHRVAELTWQQEKEELTMKIESLEVEKAACEEEVEKVKSQLKARDDEFAVLKSELEAQWSNTESMSSQIDTLMREKHEVESEKDQLQKTLAELEARIDSMSMDYNDLVNKNAQLESDLQDAFNKNNDAEMDYDDVVNRNSELESQVSELQEDHQKMERDLGESEARVEQLNRRISLLEEEVQLNKDIVSRTQETIRKRDAEIEEYSNRVAEQVAESERLQEELSTMRREYNRLLDEQSRADHSMSNQEIENSKRIEQLIKQKAEVDVELDASRDKIAALQDEVERLRRQVHTLKQDSADNEVEVGRLRKQHAADKEDIMGLNMALDAKQQELELIKRQLGVRGTAGATPAQSASATRTHRRDSSVFSATPISRPQSALSDSAESASAVRPRKRSSERPPSSASATRPSTALGRSTRINTATKSSSAGSMGPPASVTKPRSSVSSSAATPKPLGRSSSMKPSSTATSPTSTPIPHRRVSSAVVAIEQRASGSTVASKGALSRMGRVTSPVSSVPEVAEKENVDDSLGMTPTLSSRRRVAVPT